MGDTPVKAIAQHLTHLGKMRETCIFLLLNSIEGDDPLNVIAQHLTIFEKCVHFTRYSVNFIRNKGGKLVFQSNELVATFGWKWILPSSAKPKPQLG